VTDWRIIFMGTPAFACPSLQILLERGENVVGVFTQPDRPKGRGQKLQPPPVKELALQHGIPVCQPLKVRVPEVIEQIRDLKPDLIVVVAFGQILPKALLEIPPHGCVNVHASLLPRYRGAAPLNWCLVNGESETGVTTMLMDVGLDTGPMLLKKATPIGPDEQITELHDRMSRLGATLLGETLDGLKAGTIVPQPQNDAQSCYAPLLKKETGLIDWNKPAQAIHNLVRGLASWPGAYTFLQGEPLKIHRTSLGNTTVSEPAGTIVKATAEGIEVACGQGSLLIRELQAAGSRRMDATSFLAGHPLPPGTRLAIPQEPTP
jgi:methionyl-tRNA formyltransferase